MIPIPLCLLDWKSGKTWKNRAILFRSRKPGKVGEFYLGQENLEKLGNFIWVKKTWKSRGILFGSRKPGKVWEFYLVQEDLEKSMNFANNIRKLRDLVFSWKFLYEIEITDRTACNGWEQIPEHLLTLILRTILMLDLQSHFPFSHTVLLFPILLELFWAII